MASEVSWQTSSAGGSSDSLTADEPMDQRTVESLLRRLVERVEDSERRYGEALDELHARLDQLSQTTEAARETSAPEDSDTFDRLHSQVSTLARRLEQETSTPLDDFERLGKALQDGLSHDEDSTPEPSPFAKAAMASHEPEDAPAESHTSHLSADAPSESDYFGYETPAPSLPDYSAEAPKPSETFAYEAPPPRLPAEHDDLDKRLVEMAQRLEESIGSAMPTSAIEALNTRLDEIGGQLAQALHNVPTRDALDHVERQISDMGQQVTQAQEQLGKVSGIEEHLLQLIERLDEKTLSPAEPAQLEEIANKAASEAARQVAAETTKQTTERLDAMHRDLNAMSDKGRESSDRLVSTLEAVHESLKHLVQQVERGMPALQGRPRMPFVERARQADARSAPAQPASPMQARRPAMPPMDKPPAPAPTMPMEGPNMDRLRDRLGASIPDFKEPETPPPPFGRASRPGAEDKAFDLDAAMPGAGERTAPKARARAAVGLGQDQAPQDDLVAAARRAAQAAALKAEERGGGRRSRPLAGSGSAEQPGRRKRSVLIIAAATLLVVSAILLFGRLTSKPDTEATQPAVEDTAPAPEGTTAPEGQDGGEGAPAEPEKSGWAPLPGPGFGQPNTLGEATTGFTDMPKSAHHAAPMPAAELSPQAQPAALKPEGVALMPPGVQLSIEEPGEGGTEAPAPFAMPAQFPLPPEAAGPLPLRQAAASGDAKAQYAVALRYAEGDGVKQDQLEAAKWLERAASAGLAPAQYRLAAMYERGVGVDQDSGRAQSWYAAAAKKGNVKAMHNLAVSVSGRNGGTPDYATAAEWYTKAAAHGLGDSQFNLAILAENGLGMEKDPAAAYKWFALAAAQGDAEAAKRREVLRVQLSPEALAKADAEVKGWKSEPSLAEANTVEENPAWAAKAPSNDNVALVTRAQTLLNKLGYDVGPPDGIVGERTRTAIRRFESRNGLQETGEVSIPLVSQLEHLSS